MTGFTDRLSNLPPGCSDSDIEAQQDDMKTPIEHKDMVRVLMKSGEQIKDELTPLDCKLMHATIGISGEAGELLDAVKKAIFYRRPIDRENVIEELGDLEFYIEDLRATLGITREETIIANINKLAKRYEGFEYSDKAAQQRADKFLKEV